MGTHVLECGAVWGGTRNLDMDVRSDGLTASVYSKAHDGLSGGDLYHFSLCSSGMLTRIALGDVRGHGHAVAKLSSWLYDALLRQMNSLEGQEILSDLNPRVHEMGSNAITTMVVAGYYTETRTLYFAYAGHPPMLVWRRSDPVWRTLEIEGTGAVANLPLGMFPKMAYQQGTTPLEHGDRIVLCTDGVLECEDSEGVELGSAGLATMLDGKSDGTLASLKERLLRGLAQRTNDVPLADDATFMVVEMNGEQDPLGASNARMTFSTAN